MPSISKKGVHLPASPIRQLVPFAEEAKAAGTHVYHLNIGQPDLPTPPEAMQAVKDVDFNTLSYSPSAGFESLRKAFVDYYANYSIHVNSEEIIVTSGASEAIYFVLGSITDPGDQVLAPEPFYANYEVFASAMDISFKTLPSRLENDFALPPIADFEKNINAHTKAILICNPGNPSGYVYTREELEQLRQLAIKHDLFLIADEVYREFIYDDAEHTSVLELDGLEQHAVLIDSVSKRYSMCGARIGAVVTRNQDILHSVLKFAQARLSPPTFAQIASEAAMRLPMSYFDDVRRTYKARRDALIKGLSAIPGVITSHPKGAFYCMAQLPIRDADHFALWLLSEYTYQGATLMLAPGTGFYSDPEVGKRQVRIAYVLQESDLIKALEILQKALPEYQRQYPERAILEVAVLN